MYFFNFSFHFYFFFGKAGDDLVREEHEVLLRGPDRQFVRGDVGFEMGSQLFVGEALCVRRSGVPFGRDAFVVPSVT